MGHEKVNSKISSLPVILDAPIGLEQVVDACWNVFQSENPVVMLELPGVYGLIAPGTRLGVEALDRTKSRLPGKTYGSVIGRIQSFCHLVEPGALPSELIQEPALLERMSGAFIRANISNRVDQRSAVIAHGTHQGLLLPQGAMSAFFVRLEERLEQKQRESHSRADEDWSSLGLFGGKNHSAILATSANLSGDPLGSITDENRARDFVMQNRISLWIHKKALESESTVHSTEKGSFPILEVHGGLAWVRREGPGLSRILKQLPTSIQLVRETETLSIGPKIQRGNHK